jgi:hypothetical protein
VRGTVSNQTLFDGGINSIRPDEEICRFDNACNVA